MISNDTRSCIQANDHISVRSVVVDSLEAMLLLATTKGPVGALEEGQVWEAMGVTTTKVVTSQWMA